MIVGSQAEPQEGEIRCQRCSCWYNSKCLAEPEFCLYCTDSLRKLEKDLEFLKIRQLEKIKREKLKKDG